MNIFLQRCIFQTSRIIARKEKATTDDTATLTMTPVLPVDELTNSETQTQHVKVSYIIHGFTTMSTTNTIDRNTRCLPPSINFLTI